MASRTIDTKGTAPLLAVVEKDRGRLFLGQAGKVRLVLTEIHNWDTGVCTRMIRLTKNPFLSKFFMGMTRSGDGHLYFLFPILLAASGSRKARGFALAELLAFSFNLPIYKWVKSKIKRDRPFVAVEGLQNLVAPPDQFSFPSGHTAAAFLMAFVVSRQFRNLRVPLYLWAGGVGFSRVYLGVHYPTDVFAGTFLGTASAVGGVLVAERFFNTSR
jgi:undecaprenyl-diphosphatase